MLSNKEIQDKIRSLEAYLGHTLQTAESTRRQISDLQRQLSEESTTGEQILLKG
jgi:hypothetical protein